MNKGWKKTTFDHLATLHRGYDLPKAQRTSGTIPVVGSNGIVGLHGQAKFQSHGVIIGRSGSVGKSAYISRPHWPLNTTLYVENFHGNNPRFVEFFCKHFDFIRYAAGVSVPTLNRNLVHKAIITIPPLPEQKKIAAVLLKLQQAIETQDKIIQSLHDLKKSTMQHLFTRGLRGEKIKMTEIGEIPKSWDVVPISEVREFLQYGTSKRCTLEAKGIPVLRIPNVIGGKINTKELKFANILTSECERLKLVAGDLLFVRTNGQKQNVGRTAVYRSTPCSALFASYLIRARLKQDIMLPDFLQIYTEADQGRSQLSGRATPASDGKFNINTKTINSVLVPVPSLTEQGNIIGHISIISNRQDHHEKKNVTLQNLFKTTLNKLMTGDIHVDDLDIDVTQVEK